MRPTFGPNKLQNTRSRLLMIRAGVLHFELTQWEPWAATRCAVGVCIPVLIAAMTGHPAAGALAGLGALYTGFASYRGVYRSRLRSMLITALLTTLMTGLGGLVSQSDALTLIAVPAVVFVFALYATSSPLANSVATQAVCVLVVLTGLRLGPATAFPNGGLVLGGGVMQIILLTLVWPVNPRFPERKAIADAFFSLAEFFDRVPQGVDELIPGTQRFEDARSTLQEARNLRWRQEHELMVELMRSGETLRAASVGFARATENLGDDDCAAAERLCKVLSAALKYASTKILAGKFDDLSHAASKLPKHPEVPAHLAHWYGLIRDRLADLNHTTPHILDDPLIAPTEGIGWRGAFSFLTKLPDASSLRKIALGHAIRYTVTLEIALAASRFLKESHLYWLPLTVAIILRADFATTVTRGVSRLLGTVGGVIVAGIFVNFAHPSSQLFTLCALAATWFCFALLQANYAVYSIAITLYVVCSIGSAGLSAHHHSAAWIRLAATLAGSAISIAAYILWPAFQGRQLRQVISDALGAQIEFGEKVKNRRAVGDEVLEDARNHARQLRLRSESLFQTAALEPWGVSVKELAIARDAILKLDENAAELLAFRVDQETDPHEIDRVLSSSALLKSQILQELD